VTEAVRAVFLGSGAFAVPVVESLANSPGVDLVSLVTAPTKPGPRGRPTDVPVAQWAMEHGLPLLRPPRLRAAESIAELAALTPDLLVLADYGQIVPAALLDLPKFGALNLHPSLLPRHRGASPIPATILADDAETGVSLMLMDAGLDSGPLIARRRVALSGTETAPDLEHALAIVAAELLTTSLPSWLNSELVALPQAEEGVTLTKPLRRSDGSINPRESVDQLERQVRAYQPWPGTFFTAGGMRVVVWKARIADDAPQGSIGQLVRVGSGGIGLVCEGLLELLEVQPAGGRRMSGEELARGRTGIIGSVIE
jgi:methionyl-tRNA formyltransferase